MKDTIKKLVTQTHSKENNKKNDRKIENIVVFIIILIVTIIIINTMWGNDKDKQDNSIINTYNKELAQTDTSNNFITKEEVNLEQKLENILKTINGVGDVKVLINYTESSSIEAMFNENKKESSTEETDTAGGVRTIQEIDTEKEVIYSESNGNKVPATQKTVAPKIEGAIVTAEGADSATVKSNIVDAISAVTGLRST